MDLAETKKELAHGSRKIKQHIRCRRQATPSTKSGDDEYDIKRSLRKRQQSRQHQADNHSSASWKLNKIHSKNFKRESNRESARDRHKKCLHCSDSSELEFRFHLGKDNLEKYGTLKTHRTVSKLYQETLEHLIYCFADCSPTCEGVSNLAKNLEILIRSITLDSNEHLTHLHTQILHV